jgi:hypothetical protein
MWGDVVVLGQDDGPLPEKMFGSRPAGYSADVSIYLLYSLPVTKSKLMNVRNTMVQRSY